MADKKAPKKKKAASPARKTPAIKRKAPAKAAKSAPSQAADSKTTTGQPAARFFVGFTDLAVRISDAQPNGAQEVCQCDDFAAARIAAIDVLVEAIENAEDLLTRLKRAKSYTDLREANK